jgi:DNA-binding response OmpR family regulator
MRLLLVEDDYSIGRGINQTLRDQGYAVDWVRDGLAARAQIVSGKLQGLVFTPRAYPTPANLAPYA